METFHIRTFGCQMNRHDSERMAGLLVEEGLTPVRDVQDADVVVFNTCCVREHAEDRMNGQLASLKVLKDDRVVLIAVGGCVGQKDRGRLLARHPHVDVVFGTQNLAELPSLLRSAETSGSVVSVSDGTAAPASELPSRRDRSWHAWIAIAVGCDNRCTYCIVPSVRGPERSRPLEDVVDEVSHAVADGVVEITLLGQNVNSYGRDLYSHPRFAELLEAVSAAGPQRVRFTTSHPKDLSDETIRVLADEPRVCRWLHLPVQSGSSRVLERMGRTYDRDDYLALVDRVYDAVPDIALTTDIMVGFPGETEEDFEDTLDIVGRCRFDQAFTFIYSPREGTPAVDMGAHVPRDVVQERFDRLVDLVKVSALTKNEALVGTVQDVLVEGPSKRDGTLLLARTEGNKIVHFLPPAGRTPEELVGTFLDVRIETASTWFLRGRIRG